MVRSAFHTLAEDENDLKGAPWDVRSYVRRKVEDEPVKESSPVVPGAAPGLLVVQQVPTPGRADAGVGDSRCENKSPMVGVPSASGQKRPVHKKAWPVRREHLVKFGRTSGCPG